LIGCRQNSVGARGGCPARRTGRKNPNRRFVSASSRAARPRAEFFCCNDDSARSRRQIGEQPVMGGGEHDQMATRLQACGRPAQFTAVILNMFENIDVKDRIKSLARGQSATVPLNSSHSPCAAGAPGRFSTVRATVDPVRDRPSAAVGCF